MMIQWFGIARSRKGLPHNIFNCIRLDLDLDLDLDLIWRDAKSYFDTT